jgi:hypothetical protein
MSTFSKEFTQSAEWRFGLHKPNKMISKIKNWTKLTRYMGKWESFTAEALAKVVSTAFPLQSYPGFSW